MPSILTLFAFVLLVIGGYGYVNQPAQEPPWTDVVPGFAFSPYQQGQSPLDNMEPGLADIDRDLALLAGKTRAVRTYTVAGVFAEVPRLAQPHGINVAVGAWLSPDHAANVKELDRLLMVANAPPHNKVRLIVGNEALLRKDISLTQMQAYLDAVRAQTDVPVSTAEPWHVWLKNPSLAEHVDYLAVHLLPFWEGIALDQAVDFSIARYRQLQQAFPNQKIVVTEVGWPSRGRSIKDAEASPANQAKFLRRFIHRAEQEGMVFYVMEAFDQPWKSDIEGSVGGHWGVFDSAREAKFETRNPIIPMPQWKLLAAASIVAALLILILLLTDSAGLSNAGRSFLIFNAFVASTLISYVVYDFSMQYHTWGSVLVMVLLLLGVVGVFLIVLAEAHEWAEAMWYRRRLRLLAEPAGLGSQFRPFVSIHVPAHEEPPALLIDTLNALAALDYPAFEVIVVDNNTALETTWRPVQQHCEALGPRFKFHHVSPLAGYKAGALNYALAHTSPQAEVIAVVDADYRVSPNWLLHLVPQFEKPEIAIVQAPQDYRDGHDSAFKSLCLAEYTGFFQLGMITRNERNAIIQHGTMTMVRRVVLESVGGWGLDTITEDTELGLRIFEAGHEAVYINRSYGHGLIPDTFLDYKKQRHRWAYGAMQILRRHAGALFGRVPTQLTLGQRYHFVAGWLPWMSDGFNVLFTVAALVWSFLMIADPISWNAPPLLISAVPVLFIAFKATKLFTLYVWQVKLGVLTALKATLAGLSLSYTIGRATISGLLLGRPIAFVRTPKMTAQVAWHRAIQSARDETVLAVALLGFAMAVYVCLGFDAIENLMWCAVLVSQSLPFLAAFIVSMVSAQRLKKGDGPRMISS